jgi:hypothetical protein
MVHNDDMTHEIIDETRAAHEVSGNTYLQIKIRTQGREVVHEIVGDS